MNRDCASLFLSIVSRVERVIAYVLGNVAFVLCRRLRLRASLSTKAFTLHIGVNLFTKKPFNTIQWPCAQMQGPAYGKQVARCSPLAVPCIETGAALGLELVAWFLACRLEAVDAVELVAWFLACRLEAVDALGLGLVAWFLACRLEAVDAVELVAWFLACRLEAAELVVRLHTWDSLPAGRTPPHRRRGGPAPR
jgi:hypothetical protein